MTWEHIENGTFYTDQKNVIDHVYRPGLEYANLYIRDTGNFSSNVYRLMGKELLDFVLRESNNQMILICSMNIGPSDISALFDSDSLDENAATSWLISELNQMIETGGALSDPVKMFVSLVHSNKLKVVVNLRKSVKNKHAHSHSKSGLFVHHKTGQMLCFQGSLNETYPAIFPKLDEGNAESYSVYSTVDPSSDDTWNTFAAPVKERLERIMSVDSPTLIAPGTISIPLNQLKKEDFPTMNDEDWNPDTHSAKSIIRSSDLYKHYSNLLKEKSSTRLTAEMMTENRPHQKHALDAWREAGRRGILRHATGSGKTITSIAAIEEHLTQPSNFVILVVPYKALQKQWGEILEHQFGMRTINIGGDASKFQDLVIDQIASNTFSTGCVLNVIQNTFTQNQFRNALASSKLPLQDRCLFVFDECHHVGRPSYQYFIDQELYFSRVLGLSATPFTPVDETESFSDEWWNLPQEDRFAEEVRQKNARIEGLIGEVLDTFGLSEAIGLGYLTPYDYQIKAARMTEQEQNDYLEFRSKIGQQMHLDSSPAVHQSRLLIKSISGKIRIFSEIIRSNFKPGQHWLVYCAHDAFLNQARDALIEIGADWWEYTSHNINDRDLHMTLFEQRGGIMLAVKCLDEGVDIPKITHGIILSSSTVEREFVQRRGRMLRSADGKKKAVIYDAVTLPYLGTADKLIQESIMKHELSRIGHFAQDARNLQEINIMMKSLHERLHIRLE